MSMLILASKSPRRQQLLAEAGYKFTVVTPTWPEPSYEELGLVPHAFAEAASYYKASAAAHGRKAGVVLAADTVVARADRTFGKPANRQDARRILSALAGTRHEVITGVTVMNIKDGHRVITHDRTKVIMRSMSDADLEEYLASDAWQDKAGAYGIQDCADRFIERIEGSFSNVVGLPLELVGTLLKQFGIVPTPPDG